ncbi:MAG: hypothetical protein DRG11_05105 [Epsilonproteobacteria bacterium]|nr:MAG: hypothetical protein DRG11_05105 [Campylobacterota bacterium]
MLADRLKHPIFGYEGVPHSMYEAQTSWHKDELIVLLDICIKNNIVVFSDEIHCDLVYAPHTHTVFAGIDDKAKDITISAFGVGKPTMG